MARHAILASLTALLLSVSSNPLLAQSEAKQAKEPGPAIGSSIKNFKLVDQTGKMSEWKQYLGKGPIAVVFHRSADW